MEPLLRRPFFNIIWSIGTDMMESSYKSKVCLSEHPLVSREEFGGFCCDDFKCRMTSQFHVIQC